MESAEVEKGIGDARALVGRAIPLNVGGIVERRDSSSACTLAVGLIEEVLGSLRGGESG